MEHSGGLPRGAGIRRSPEGCARPRWEEGGGLWSEGTEDAKAWSEQGGATQGLGGVPCGRSAGPEGEGRGGRGACGPDSGQFLGPKQLGLPGHPKAQPEVRAVTGMLGQTDIWSQKSLIRGRSRGGWRRMGTEDTWEPILRATPQLTASLNHFVSDCESDSGEDLCGIRERGEEK